MFLSLIEALEVNSLSFRNLICYECHLLVSQLYSAELTVLPVTPPAVEKNQACNGKGRQLAGGARRQGGADRYSFLLYQLLFPVFLEQTLRVIDHGAT